MIPPAENTDSPETTDVADRPYFLKVVEDPTNDRIRHIPGPLNFISVMGPARSGKSTLMNLLAGCKETELFATDPGMETFTKGIYVPSGTLSLPQFSSLDGGEPIEDGYPDIKVSFIDTEGQGALGAAYDLNLFSAALITSRVVMYNRTGGLLTEEILGQLGMMTQAAQRLQAAGGPAEANGHQTHGDNPTGDANWNQVNGHANKIQVNGHANGNQANGHAHDHQVNGDKPTGNANGDQVNDHANDHEANGYAHDHQVNGDKPTADANGAKATRSTFGHLFIVFNQFRLNRVDTAETLKDKLFKPEKETGSAAINRNKIRALLVSVFESIQVFILPDKLKEEARDALSDETKKILLLDDFQPKYRESFSVLRRRLAEALKTPRQLFPGQPLTGGAVADFMPLFTDAINKSEPLNVPTIFEAGQKQAIAKVKLDFSVALRPITEQYTTAEEPKATQRLARMFDGDVAVLLARVSVSLSYMPTTVTNRVSRECTELAQPSKEALLAANLNRLKSLMSTELLTSLDRLSQDIERRLGCDAEGATAGLLVSASIVDGKVQEALTVVKEALKSKGDAYDSASIPEDWEKTLSTAAESKRIDIMARVNQAWTGWVAQASRQGLDALAASLIEQGKPIKFGEVETYKAVAVTALGKAKREFEARLASEYAGADPAAHQAKFSESAEAIVAMQQAQRTKELDDVRKELSKWVDWIELDYKEQLRKSVEPNVEPLDFSTATDESVIMDNLRKFSTANNVSEKLVADAEHKLRTFVSDEKSTFRGLYNKARQEFGQYLEDQLKHQTPLLLRSFQRSLDQIGLTTLKPAVEKQCDETKIKIINGFEALKSQWQLKPDGVVSKTILQTARATLQEAVDVEIKAKLVKYDEVVSAYNKALLSEIVVPLIDKSTGNKYATDIDLNNEVKAAETDFYKRCHGDPETDAKLKWNTFKKSTYPALVETVKRFNAFTVPGLPTNEAISKEIQLHIIRKIWPSCANLANMLHMSWVATDTFTGKPWDRGHIPNAGEGAKENNRVFRLTNTTLPGDGKYKVDRSTNLEFFDWTVEVSEIQWGKPIVTDLKPLKVNSTQYPPQPKEFPVQVGNVDTYTTTATDTTSWGISGGGKYSYSWGTEALSGKHAFEASFGAKFDRSSTDGHQSTYTTDTRATLMLPANRSNLIHQMVFDQRTTLPYTAKVRVVPRLRFQNGFTIWGGGGSYRDNPNAGAIKDQFKKEDEDRVFQDFDFRRVDEIRDDAEAEADPWFWKLATSELRDPHRCLRNALDMLADPKNTEVYIKGKCEGITGKYAVTTVAPEATNLTLLPGEM